MEFFHEIENSPSVPLKIQQLYLWERSLSEILFLWHKTSIRTLMSPSQEESRQVSIKTKHVMSSSRSISLNEYSNEALGY